VASVPHVVLIRVDFAPWDSDVTDEVRLIEFEDRAAAYKFHEEAVKIALNYSPDIIIQAFEPEPVVGFGADTTLALALLVDWLAEDDPYTDKEVK
jgi:hypothetical protein